MLLAADVGGTNTNLAVFPSHGSPHSPLAEATLPSAGYSSLGALIREFLAQLDSATIRRASLGVAGPVVAERATITNLPWVLDKEQLQQSLGLSTVHLLNDLEAIAYAVPVLRPDDLHTLNQGKPTLAANVAIIAPGTGLGEAFLTCNGSRYQAHASEGGHADFAPQDPLQVDLLRYLWDRFDHVSYERVCSGIGMPNIYAYLKDSGYAQEPVWLAEKLAALPDPTPLIVNNALQRKNELCVAALDMFVSILGSEAGNLALKVLATGGVYLGGGIPPRILPALSNGRFILSFQNKGRFTELMTRIPIHVILNPKAALLGAARYGLDMEKQQD